ncbi:MAG: efflux RND transporter periplasmic adaptor subunit, partial [Planctomycetota bacterium]
SPVRTAKVQFKTVQQFRSLTGNLRPQREAMVAAVEPARVTEILFDEAQPVKQGDVLVRQDDRRLRQEMLAAEADVAVAQAEVAEREAELERLRLDAEAQVRARDQMEGSVSELDVRAAKTAVATAEAQLDASRKRVAASEAAIETLRVRVADLEIRAPFDGVVIRRDVEAGEWLGSGGVVGELMTDQIFEAVIDVPEDFNFAVLSQADPKSVMVTVDTHNFEATPIKLRTVPNVDPRSRRFALVADVRSDDPGKPLAAGMSVTAQVPTGDEAEHLVVPYDALLQNPVGYFVYTARPPGPNGEPSIAVPTQVDILFRLGNEVAVRSRQLEEGADVIVEGGERIMGPMSPIDPRPLETENQSSAAASDTR